MRNLCVLLVGSLCLSLGTASALAQDSKSAGSDPAPVKRTAASATAPIDEVTVTGSRIIRNGNEAPTPVTVVTMAELQLTSPTNIPDALNKLPGFINSRGQGTFAGSQQPFSINTPNLRDFGANRVLILQDGRRVPPTSYDGTVDLNGLPQLLVQRVEVTTGGASAVYGSDAVTGVVNFILDNHFNGIKGVIQDGISSRGDDNSWRGGVAAGFDFATNGHAEFSAEHYQDAGIPHMGARPYGNSVYITTGGGTAANPFVLTPNGRNTTTSLGGLVTSGPFKGQQFLPNGQLGIFNAGTPTGSAGASSGGDGAYLPPTVQTLITPLRTCLLYTSDAADE